MNIILQVRDCNSFRTLTRDMKSAEGTNPIYVSNDERIAIIGAGVAGIATAAALNSAGFVNIVVYDKHDTMGGLWVENYPNASGMFCFLT